MTMRNDLPLGLCAKCRNPKIMQDNVAVCPNCSSAHNNPSGLRVPNITVSEEMLAKAMSGVKVGAVAEDVAPAPAKKRGRPKGYKVKKADIPAEAKMRAPSGNKVVNVAIPIICATGVIEALMRTGNLPSFAIAQQILDAKNKLENALKEA